MQVPHGQLNSNPKPHAGTHNVTLRVVTKNAQGGVGLTASSVPLWIYELESNFGITGSTAQSVSKRDFYPRNFNQPSYTFRGQTHSEREYAELAEFIREGQLGTIFGDRLFVIDAPASGPMTEAVNTVTSHGRTAAPRRRRINRNLKGRRPGIKLQGYITAAPRTHERWVNAPEYEFEFVVSRHLAGPIIDPPIRPHVLPVNWNSFITRGNAGIIADPDEQLLDTDARRREEKHDDDDVDDMEAFPPGYGVP